MPLMSIILSYSYYIIIIITISMTNGRVTAQINKNNIINNNINDNNVNRNKIDKHKINTHNNNSNIMTIV